MNPRFRGDDRTHPPPNPPPSRGRGQEPLSVTRDAVLYIFHLLSIKKSFKSWAHSASITPPWIRSLWLLPVMDEIFLRLGKIKSPR